MSVPSESNGRPNTPDGGMGVLSNLPRTRPQRSSARRTAAREAGATAGPPSAGKPRVTGKPKASTRKKTTASAASASSVKGKPKARAKAKAEQGAAATTRVPLVKTAISPRAEKPRGKPSPKAAARKSGPVDESVPRQGFESELDRASGPVQPPGGAELVATAAEIVSELAKAGVSTGERLLKDFLGRLPLS